VIHGDPRYEHGRSVLLSVNEVAALLGISRPTVYRLARRGDLASYRVGERLRFKPAEIEDYLERNREPAATG
jgi:putative molybdopterin biosynthesis protein